MAHPTKPAPERVARPSAAAAAPPESAVRGRLAGVEAGGDSPFVPEELLRRERVPRSAWVLLGLLGVTGVVSIVLTSLDRGGLWTLFLYSVPSNTVIAVLPHEPMLLIYGARADLWLATLAATAGTVLGGWLDHRIFVPLLNVERISGYKRNHLYQKVMRLFGRAPFAAIAIAGCTPVPFFPFKLLAFSGGYPLERYLGALALGRMPRYALILWIGSVVGISTWLLVGAAVLALAAWGAHFLVRSSDHSATDVPLETLETPRQGRPGPYPSVSGSS